MPSTPLPQYIPSDPESTLPSDYTPPPPAHARRRIFPSHSISSFFSDSSKGSVSWNGKGRGKGRHEEEMRGGSDDIHDGHNDGSHGNGDDGRLEQDQDEMMYDERNLDVDFNDRDRLRSKDKLSSSDSTNDLPHFNVVPPQLSPSYDYNASSSSSPFSPDPSPFPFPNTTTTPPTSKTSLFQRIFRRRNPIITHLPQSQLEAELEAHALEVTHTRHSLRQRQRLNSTASQNPPPVELIEQEGEDEEEEKLPSMKKMVVEDSKAILEYVKELGWRGVKNKFMAKRLIKWYIILAVVAGLSAVIAIKHDSIVDWMKPKIVTIKGWPAGWLIPIVILIIVSFPPLFGHEIIGILVGIVWGLGEGFGILAAGTFAGEMAVWWGFKWFCGDRAKKFERKNKYYAALTQLIRDKSFFFVLILRFSAIPGHVTTALSSSAGAHVWSYVAAAVLTLPKQLSLVYLGTAFDSSSHTSHIISVLTTLLTIAGTGVAAVYIYYQMRLYLLAATRKLEKEESAARIAAAHPVDAEGTGVVEGGGGGGGRPEMRMLNRDEREEMMGLERKLQNAGYPPPYRPPSIASYSPYNNPDGGETRLPSHMQSRRPYLRQSSSTVNLVGKPGLVRARSLPRIHDDPDFLAAEEEYIRGIRSGRGRERSDTVTTSRTAYQGLLEEESENEDGLRSRVTPMHEENEEEITPASSSGSGFNGTGTPSGFGLTVPQITRGRPRSGTTSTLESLADRFLVEPLDKEPVRGTTSMDMWRPMHMTLGDAGNRSRERSPFEEV